MLRISKWGAKNIFPEQRVVNEVTGKMKSPHVKFTALEQEALK